MRALKSTHATATAVGGLVAIGLLVVSWRELPAWGNWTKAQEEQERLDAYQRFVIERTEIHRCLTVDLASGRVSLAQAIELMIRANTGGDKYLEALQNLFPALSPEESVARNLLLRVEEFVRADDSARRDIVACLKDEYTSIFGRRPPPRPDMSPEGDADDPGRPGGMPPGTMMVAE